MLSAIKSAPLTANDFGAERTQHDNVSRVPLQPAPAENTRSGFFKRIRFALPQLGPLALPPPPPTPSPAQELLLRLDLIESADPIRPACGVDTFWPAMLSIRNVEEQQRLVVGFHATDDRTRSAMTTKKEPISISRQS